MGRPAWDLGREATGAPGIWIPQMAPGSSERCSLKRCLNICPPLCTYTIAPPTDPGRQSHLSSKPNSASSRWASPPPSPPPALVSLLKGDDCAYLSGEDSAGPRVGTGHIIGQSSDTCSPQCFPPSQVLSHQALDVSCSLLHPQGPAQ